MVKIFTNQVTYRDIVDTKSHNDHVPDMFMGSIDEAVDDKDKEDRENF